MSATTLNDAYLKILSNPRIYKGELKDCISTILVESALALDVSRASIWLLSENQNELKRFLLYDVKKGSV